MSRILRDEKTLCNDISTFINVQRSYDQQRRIAAKAPKTAGATSVSTTTATAAVETDRGERVGKKRARRQGAGSVWIVMKGSFASLEASPKTMMKRSAFREHLQASKVARREAAAANAAAAAPEEEEEEEPLVADDAPEAAEALEEVEEGEVEAEAEIEAEYEEESHAVATERLPVGAPFAALVVRMGGKQDELTGGLNDDEPTKCIVRVRSSRPNGTARSLPPAVAPTASKKSKASKTEDPKAAKKALRAQQRKLQRRSVRGLHRRSTTILATQKSANYFKTNIMQVIKREVMPFMEKSMTAAPTIGTTPFSDVPLLEVTPATPIGGDGKKEKAAAGKKAGDSAGGKAVAAQPAPPAKPEAPKAPPSSGKTKAQQKQEESQKKPADNKSSAKPSSAAKGGKGKK